MKSRSATLRPLTNFGYTRTYWILPRNVASWLKADLQPPEFDFRFAPVSRRFRDLG